MNLESWFTLKTQRRNHKIKPTTASIIINILTKTGCHIHRVETTKASLEDVFLKLTGKGINE